MLMMIDFHLHSKFSDGLDTPSQLIESAMNSNFNLKAVALTDHDSIDGLQEFVRYGEESDIITISGVELSIRHELEREIKDVHVIGLNIDYTSLKIIQALKEQLKGRIEQKERICSRLRDEFGYEISFEEVKKVSGSKSVGRPHIVQVMIKNNPEKVKGKTKNELFKLISLGGPAYVHREVEFTLEDAIELIDSVGAIPILAHPGIYEVEDRKKFIEMCIKAGIKGIEIEYTYAKNRPFYGTEKANWAQNFLPDYYRKLADNLNLIKSGGSDYHGGKKGIEIGEARVPLKYLKDFI